MFDFSGTPVKEFMLTAAAAVVLSFSLLHPFSVGIAHADNSDQEFLSLLAGQGITGHDASTLTGTGRGVCTELETTSRSPGFIGAEILSLGRAYGPGDSLADPAKVEYLVAAAIAVYCPQFKTRVGQ